MKRKIQGKRLISRHTFRFLEKSQIYIRAEIPIMNPLGLGP